MSANDGSSANSPTDPSRSAKVCYVCGRSGPNVYGAGCRACKEFYQRSWEQYTCESGNKCEITEKNRNNCKACRFKKCIEIGMEPKKPASESEEEKQVLECNFCGKLSARVRYGVPVCVACRLFFENHIGKKFPCKSGENGPCVITSKTRVACTACRLEMCVKAGMKRVTPLKDAIPCKVCGFETSGVRYGVDTCQPCGDFFSKNNRRKDFACVAMTDECEVTVKTRAQCSACRLKKCLELGMISSNTNAVPCEICEADDSNSRHGAPACKACTSLFEREYKKEKREPCKAGGKCRIEAKNHTKCTACRYEKCLKAGMKMKGVKRPNNETIQDDDDAEQILRAHKRYCIHTAEAFKIAELKKYDISELHNNENEARPGAWKLLSNEFRYDFEKVKNFINLLPRLDELVEDDKRILLKKNYFPIFLLRLARGFTDEGAVFYDGRYYDRKTSELLYGDKFYEEILQLAKKVSHLPDDVISLIITVMLFQPIPENKLTHPKKVKEMRKHYNKILKKSVTLKVHRDVLPIVSKLADLNDSHYEMLEFLRNKEEAKRFKGLIFAYLFDIKERNPWEK